VFTSASRHSETFSAEPRAALLSLFVLKCIEDRGLIDHAASLGQMMMSALADRLADVEQVGEVRGLGLMQGVEFVEDRQTKRPAIDLRDRIVKACVHRERLWVLGSGRSTIRFLPALTTSAEEAMEAVDRFVRAVRHEVDAARQASPGHAAS
jgi:4-aminobutyrate aminotransferase